MVCPEDKAFYIYRFHLPSLKQVPAYTDNWLQHYDVLEVSMGKKLSLYKSSGLEGISPIPLKQNLLMTAYLYLHFFGLRLLSLVLWKDGQA